MKYRQWRGVGIMAPKNRNLNCSCSIASFFFLTFCLVRLASWMTVAVTHVRCRCDSALCVLHVVSGWWTFRHRAFRCVSRLARLFGICRSTHSFAALASRTAPYHAHRACSIFCGLRMALSRAHREQRRRHKSVARNRVWFCLRSRAFSSHFLRISRKHRRARAKT